MKKVIYLLLTISFLFILTSCKKDKLDDNKAKEEGYEVGNLCYDLTIDLVNSNNTFSISKNRGKVIVLNFWFTKCPYCINEMPSFNNVYQKYKNDIEIVAIHMNGNGYNEEIVIDYINNNYSNYSITFGIDTKNNDNYELLGGTGSYPVTVILNQDGIITYNKAGAISERFLIKRIEELL